MKKDRLAKSEMYVLLSPFSHWLSGRFDVGQQTQFAKNYFTSQIPNINILHSVNGFRQKYHKRLWDPMSTHPWKTSSVQLNTDANYVQPDVEEETNCTILVTLRLNNQCWRTQQLSARSRKYTNTPEHVFVFISWQTFTLSWSGKLSRSKYNNSAYSHSLSLIS